MAECAATCAGPELAAGEGWPPATPAWLAGRIRAGRCPPDPAFDQLLPRDLQQVSSEYWTPLPVALAAARWLEEQGTDRVVDIGAGPGKFCLTVALASRCEVVGFEHRPRLVAVARALARQFGVEQRASFVEGSLRETPLPQGGAYYLYNPFAENLYGPSDALGDDVELSCARYALDVRSVLDTFRRAPQGTLVLTYNGFGGGMPSSYEPIRTARDLPCVLRMWRKTRASDDGGFSAAGAD
jgi:SAM-dependent methyltransferase